jgi:hypothetical protein
MAPLWFPRRRSISPPTSKSLFGLVAQWAQAETLRALAGVELTRAVGGDETLLFQSDEKNCVEAVSPPVVPR